MALSQTAQIMVDRVLNGHPAKTPDRASGVPKRTATLDGLDGPDPDLLTDHADLAALLVGDHGRTPPEPVADRYRQDIDRLLGRWLDDDPDVELVAVEGPPLPADATRTERAVAQFALIVKGLMLGYDWRDPMILARSFVHDWFSDPRMTAALGLRRAVEERQIGNILKTLTTWRFLVVVGTMPIAGKAKPAYLYEFGVIPGRPEIARLSGEQPDDHALDDLLVAGAELGRATGPLDAAESGTRNGVDGVLHSPIMPHGAVASAPLNAIGGPW